VLLPSSLECCLKGFQMSTKKRPADQCDLYQHIVWKGCRSSHVFSLFHCISHPCLTALLPTVRVILLSFGSEAEICRLNAKLLMKAHTQLYQRKRASIFVSSLTHYPPSCITHLHALPTFLVWGWIYKQKRESRIVLRQILLSILAF
jgi:hypothetical protein